jgi:uncharacterized LabA/DUF88 family protein
LNDQPLRVDVFIDWQNVYEGARAAFGFGAEDGHIAGNIDPWKTALGLAGAQDPLGRKRSLQSVRIYRGMPDRERNAKTHGASRAQMAAWEQRGGDRVHVKTRKLRYASRHDTSGYEKGIDVQLAVDLVEVAIRERADRAVVFSSDNDLVPALELAIDERGEDFVEVVAWRSEHAAPPLYVPGKGVTRRMLGREAYDKLFDPTDYTLPKSLRNKQQGDWDAQIAAEGRVPRRRPD